MNKISALTIALCLILTASSLATTWTVNSYAGLQNAISNAAPGDLIELQPGLYSVTTSRLSFYNSGIPGAPITIRGVIVNGQRPVLDASGQDINRGIFHLWPQDSWWVIENLEFTNARGGTSYSQNAAAAYIRGDHVVFRNCYSHHNDNGWFSSSESEDLLIENCETAFNGTGTGYTHNFYMASQDIHLRGCYTHSSIGGINYKDRSTHTLIEGCVFENAGGYDIDWASNGSGNALMTGNLIIRTTNAGNRKIINIGDGTGLRTGTISLIGNTIIAGDNNFRIFERHSSATAQLSLFNNIVYGSSRVFENNINNWLANPTTGSANWFPSSGANNVASNAPALNNSLFGTSPGFVNASASNYKLSATSPCIDQGNAFPTWRDATGTQRVRLGILAPNISALGSTLRPQDQAIDIGCFEYGAPADLAVGGSFDVNEGSPFLFGIQGDPGTLFYLLVDLQSGFQHQFPGIAGALHLSLNAWVVTPGIIPATGQSLLELYLPPNVPSGIELSYQVLRFDLAGLSFSQDCPKAVLTP